MRDMKTPLSLNAAMGLFWLFMTFIFLAAHICLRDDFRAWMNWK